MITTRRRFVTGALVLLASPLAATGDEGAKRHRAGFILTGAPGEVEHLTKAFDEGLRELGYVEGRNIAIERRFADGVQERLAGLAADLVRRNVDVIVTGSNPVIAAVKQATATIPIVMAASRDPVGSGFVLSLSRPGGNITGLSSDPAPGIVAKNLELLKEVVPTASRIALMWNPAQKGAEAYRDAAATAARRLGVTLRNVEVRGRNDLDGAFSAMTRARVEGIVVIPDPVVYTARADIARLASRHRLPAIYAHPEHAEAGGLMAYGARIAPQFRRAAVYVDKILKGAKPGDLAVEQATEFQLVVNMKAARSLRVTIPPSLLLRADQVLE